MISSSSRWFRSRLNREMMGIMKIMGSLLAGGARPGQSCPGQGVRKKHSSFHNPKSKIHILIIDFNPFPMRQTLPSQTRVPVCTPFWAISIQASLVLVRKKIFFSQSTSWSWIFITIVGSSPNWGPLNPFKTIYSSFHAGQSCTGQDVRPKQRIILNLNPFLFLILILVMTLILDFLHSFPSHGQRCTASAQSMPLREVCGHLASPKGEERVKWRFIRWPWHASGMTVQKWVCHPMPSHLNAIKGQ